MEKRKRRRNYFFANIKNGQWFKQCSLCLTSFVAENKDGLAVNFNRNRSENDGFSYRCKRCTSAYAAKYGWSSHTRKKHPEKHNARVKTTNAIASGRLIKRPCAVCGSPRVQAHHADYSKPLSIAWLCIKHHREEHERIDNEKQAKRIVRLQN